MFRTWAGRFQRGRVQEVVREAEARPGDEATVTELDLKLEDWASAELKSVAADVYHALIIFWKGKGAESCPDQQGGRRIRGLASVSQQVRADQQSECSREAGRDFAHAI